MRANPSPNEPAMSAIAFLCHPTVGHVNGLLSIARQMGAEGHSPRFLIPGAPPLPFRLRPDVLNNVVDVPLIVERAGVPVTRLKPALGVVMHALVLPWTSGYTEMRRAQALFTSGMVGTTRHILRSLEQQPVDALVVDFFFHPGLFAAEKLGLPFVSLYHSGLPFRGPQVPPFGSGLPIGDRGPAWEPAEAEERALVGGLRAKLDAARRALGLPPGAEDPVRTPVSPWLNLIPSHERIEAPRDGLGRNTAFIGPCTSTRRGAASEPFPFEKLEEGTFKVYVSLGTVFNSRPDVFLKLIEGLDQPGVQVVVSAGASQPTLASKVKSERVLLFRRVPQLELLPRMDLVVGHGGNNSTNETLAAGKPLLVVPVGGEQHDNARRVEYLGVGLSLGFKTMTVEDVRRAVARLRTEPHFAEKARELKGHLDRTDGTRTAAALIAHLAKRKAPVLLPEGAPRTLHPDDVAPVLAANGGAA